MKTYVVIISAATLVVLVHITSVDAAAGKIHQECQSDPATHADDAILKKFYDGEEVDKSVIGPHIVCMTKKFGIINEDGKINKEKLKSEIARGITDEAKLQETLEKCSEEKDTVQETAIAVDKCFWDNVIKKSVYRHH